MGAGLSLVSVDFLRGNAQLFQTVIQQDPGSGSTLPVHIPFSGQGLNTRDSAWIPFFYHQSLNPLHALDQRHRLPEHGLQIGNIVNAVFLVQQMGGRHMTFAPFQAHQPGHTAHMGAGHKFPRIMIRHHIPDNIQNQVMASDQNGCVLYLFQRPVKSHPHLVSGLHPLAVLGNHAQAVRPYQRHGGAGAPA